jgi:hypothetical protein
MNQVEESAQKSLPKTEGWYWGRIDSGSEWEIFNVQERDGRPVTWIDECMTNVARVPIWGAEILGKPEDDIATSVAKAILAMTTEQRDEIRVLLDRLSDQGG